MRASRPRCGSADRIPLFERSLRVVEQIAKEMSRRTRGELNKDEVRSLLTAHILPIVDRYDSRYRFESYVAQRFRWVAMSEFRKRRRRKRLLEARTVRSAATDENSGSVEFSAPQATPEHAVMLKQRYARLTRAVDKLSSQHARVIRRHFLENTACRELADELGISRSSVYRLRKEAMIQLAEELRDC